MRGLGLSLDNLVSAEVVTADGQVMAASEREHADLFWALRQLRCVHVARVTTAFPRIPARATHVSSTREYDPDNLFRVNQNIES